MKIYKRIAAATLASVMTFSMLQAFAARTEVEEVKEVYEVEGIIMPYPNDYVSVSPSTSITTDAELREKLAEVTLKAKQTLGIGDEYEKFSGDFSDNITNRVWYLYWYKEDVSVDVTAAEDGTILRYSKYTNVYEPYDYSNYFNPAFQKTSRSDAKVIAERFLNRVLKDNETFIINDYEEILNTRGVSNYYFNAVIKVNGIESPINAQITVSPTTMEVSNFYRNDAYNSYYGGFPEVSVNIDELSAWKILSGKFTPQLKYHIYYDENDVEHKNPKAELRYTFVSTGDWFVDAKTGDVTDRNTLYNDAIYASGDKTSSNQSVSAEMEEAVADESGGYQLTEKELEGIDKLEGVLTGAELTKIVNERYPEFGLKDFEISSATYTQNQTTEEITASISYTQRVTSGSQIGMTEEGFKTITDNKQVLYIRKYCSVDGKTGELKSYNTSYPYFDRKYVSEVVSKFDTKAAAEAFLSKNFEDKFKTSALTNTHTNEYYNYDSLQFTHTVNGYNLDCNYLSVNVNNINGNIDSFYVYWIENVEFDSADGIITAEKAIEAYAENFEAKLQYITIPVKIDPSKPEFEIFVQNGYNYVSSFLAAYMLNNVKNGYAVNAKTGELMTYNYENTSAAISYTDISSLSKESREKIEKLAQYGITFGTSEFKPSKILTQRDMLIFLLNALGYGYSENNEKEDYNNALYDNAIYRKFITKEEINEDSLITRKEALKTIIRATEYGLSATLKGIYKTGFADESKIGSDYVSYVAIATALDLVTADKDGNLNPSETITREEFAAMLYAFMDR